MFPLRVALMVSSSLHDGEANSRLLPIAVEVAVLAGERDEVGTRGVLLDAEVTVAFVEEELAGKAEPSFGVASPLQAFSNNMVVMAALATGSVGNLITGARPKNILAEQTMSYLIANLGMPRGTAASSS